MSTTIPSREQQIYSAKERLLALLDNGNSTAQPQASADPTACPKCGTAGFDPATWCGGCGYCPKTGYEGGPLHDGEHAGELNIWSIVPAWLWLLLGVSLAIIAGSFYFSWAIGQHYARSMVSLALLGLSSLLIVVSHFRAYFSTLSTTHSQGTFDLIMKPLTIWRITFRGLPANSFLLCSLAWGMTGVLMSVGVIGGLDYMSIHEFVARDEPVKLPSASDVAGVVIKSAAALQTEETAVDMQSLMGAVQEAAGDQGTGGEGPQDIEAAVAEFANATSMPEVDGESGGGEDVQDPINHPSGGMDESEQGSGHSEETTDGEEDSAENEGEDAEVGIATRVNPAEPDEDESEGGPTAPAESGDDEAASANESPTPADVTIAALPEGEVVTCAIVGYTVNSAGEPRSLLLAAPMGGDWRYVARLPVDEIPATVWEDLNSRFATHRSSRPLVACPFGGQWLTPDFFCDVHFPDSTTGLRFSEPTFIELQEHE